MTSRKKSRKKKGNKGLGICLGILVFIGLVCGYLLFTGMSRDGKQHDLLIDANDNIDSVYHKMQPLATPHSFWMFKKLATLTNFKDHIHTGRYEIGSTSTLMTFRHIKNGIQAPVKLTIGSVRTIDRLARLVSKKMMFTQKELLDSLSDKEVCGNYGYTPDNIIAMFIPNTYDLYWNISVKKFLDRMQKESKKFWTPERREKAKTAGLSPLQVMTLASIVAEETANEEEMPMIAGMYINRLNKDMMLQADPTVKFATKQFEARRIYNSMLKTDSPYNTYRNKGLPPGPIRIPSVAAIDAVLNHIHHNYLYMCAKEDFSGTHNFASTYEEHKQNASRYAKALNERGIK